MVAPPKKKTRREKEKLSEEKGKKQSVAYISEEVVFSHILPRLPFKSLCRFKSVRKNWCQLISADPLFALHQSCCGSAISSGAVFAGCGGPLVFLPTHGSPVGVSDPSLRFLPTGQFIRIVASTNGLLCLECRDLYYNSFYVCNPATKEGQVIHNDKFRLNAGLAFDPLRSPSRYKLVYPQWRPMIAPDFTCTVGYGFEVFSSDTGKWVDSSQNITTEGSLWYDGKPVFTGGGLYWDCFEHLLSFDPEKDLAGCRSLPKRESRDIEQEIGAWDGRVTCTRVNRKSVKVWVMSSCSSYWEKRHQVSLEGIMERNIDVFSSFWHTMSLRSRRASEGLFERCMVRPVPYDGGERLCLRVRREKWSGEEIVFSYDMKTREVARLCMARRRCPDPRDEYAFSYHNSMVVLPKLYG